MIRHLFKLMWKRKGSNFLIILEIFFSCFVLFLLISFVGYRYNNYSKPLGFTYDNTMALELSHGETHGELSKVKMGKIVEKLRLIPGIEVSLSKYAVPFKYGPSQQAELIVNDVPEKVFISEADDNFLEMMGLNVLEGRWFNEQDNGSRARPIVINKALREKFFGNGSAINREVEINKERYIIVGLIETYRKNLNDEIKPALFSRYNNSDTTSSAGDLLIHCKQEDISAMEEKLTEATAAVLASDDWDINFKTLQAYKEADLNENFSMVSLNFIIYGFLIINIAMGLFGVLWNNINLRKSELGLRRAIGATSVQVYRQVLGEALILTTFGVIPAFIFMIQLPLLNFLGFAPHIYINAIMLTVPIIYLFTAFCALYPGSQAAKIQPAIALHEE